MKDWDFDWFGKGLTGYAHYRQAFDRSFPSEKRQPGTGRRRAESSARPTKTDKEPSGQPGKQAKSSQAGLWLLVLAVAALWYLVLLVQRF